MSKIILKKSSVSNKIPLSSDLDYGELALNYADGKLYFKNASNVINAFASNILTDTVAAWSITSTFAGVTNPTDIYFKPDGTKMFLSTASTLNQYTLSTAWDITTAGTVTSFTNTWDTATLGMFISPDGTKLVTCGQTAVVNSGLGIAASEDRAYYLTLSTPWDITTATLVSSLRFGIGDAGLPAAETAPAGITFNSDGTIMYVIGSIGDYIYQYTVSTAYNVSTATYSKQLSISSVETGGTGIRFNTDGTRVYITGTTGDSIYEYRLTTAWDIATAVYYDSGYIGHYEATAQGIYIDETSNSAYLVGTTNDLVTKFVTNSAGISITPALTNGNGKIDLVGDTRVKNGNLYVNKSLQVDSTITVGGSITSGSNISANQISTSTSAITLGGSITTGATTITSTQTTGLITIGGTAGTGTITLGQSTAAQTLNLATGATAISTTKTINIGTGGVSGSISNITIGSATGGTDTTLNVSGRVAVIQPTGGIGNVSNTAGGTTVTGVGTLFTRTFQVGDTITIGGQTVAISAIASDTSMTTAAITSANTNVAYTLTGGTRLIINGNGNIAVGAPTPAGRLHIRQDQDGTTRQIIQNRNATGSPVSELTFITSILDLSDSRYAYIQSSGGFSNSIIFGTSNGAAPTEKLRITATGAIAFGGATAYGTTGQVLTSQGNTTPIWTTLAGTGTVTSVAALTLGTTGTDITSTVATGTTTPVITLNIPTASASNRGALSAADWTTFNNKLSSYTETDTLATVTARGATTTTAVTFSNVTITGAISARYTTKSTATTTTTSVTPDVSVYNQYSYTALAAGLTINAPIGTPLDGDKLTLRIVDNGTSQTLTWNTAYKVIGTVLPTATVASKTLYVGCIYNASLTRWDVIAVAKEV